MAKANVLARRIRAYKRRIAELDYLQTGLAPHHVAAQRETQRLRWMLDGAETDLSNFLATRKKGPWAALARAEAE